MRKPLETYVGTSQKLNVMPQLYYGNPNVTVGNLYPIKDVEGSNFWLIDDDGEKCSFGSSRFDLN